MKNYVWLVTEVNVDEPIPKIESFQDRSASADLFDKQIKDLSKKYDFTQEFKKGESFTRIFGNKDTDEIKVILQMLKKELHA